MRAVLTVIGKDRVGIIHQVSGILAEHQVNILDITQTILQDVFTMIMIVDLQGCTLKFEELQKKLDRKGIELGLSVRIQHEDIFNSMHQI